MNFLSWVLYLGLIAYPSLAILMAKRAQIMDYPYLAHVIGKNPKTQYFRCSAMAIHNNLLLTTATACLRSELKFLTVNLGRTEVFNVRSDANVKRVIVAPQWSENEPERHNLCILELTTAIPWSKTFQKAGLPYQDEPLPPIGMNFSVAGWGRHQNQNLDEEHLFVYKDGILHGRTFPNTGHVLWEVFQIGFQSKTQNNEKGDIGKPAMGDEGSPIYLNQAGKVIGLVNKIRPARNFDKFVNPVAAIQISHYRNWIEEIRRTHGVAP